MASPAQHATASAQYLIYTFDFPREGQRAQSRWHRYAALADEELALAQAQILSDTQKYRRIEVKKKYFDPARGRAIDTTLRIYENGARAMARRWALIASAGLCAVGLILWVALAG